MLYAVDSTGNQIEATKGATGTCSLCKLPLIPKCGEINVWHWSHRAGECDPWNEGESEWHRAWKRRADRTWCEVVMPPHRADIRRPDGLVIELQKSSISVADIGDRETFYGNMWWLFHRERFGENARFFVTEDHRVRLRWLGGSRRLPRVSKPMFCDLGGPIVEFTGRVDGVGGWGRVLTRGEFIAKAGMRPLDQSELSAFSHYEVRWEPDGGDRKTGILLRTEAELSYWCTDWTGYREVRWVRHDGSFESLSQEDVTARLAALPAEARGRRRRG